MSYVRFPYSPRALFSQIGSVERASFYAMVLTRHWNVPVMPEFPGSTFARWSDWPECYNSVNAIANTCRNRALSFQHHVNNNTLLVSNNVKSEV